MQKKRLMSYKYIVIEGNIGAGKTSLANKLTNEYNAKLILEQFEDNPFLPKFYKDPDKYSFHVELAFLASRYQQLNKDLPYQNLFKTFTIADYYFSKSLIFASVTLSDAEYNLYRQIFNIIYKTLPKPDLYVYIHLPTNRLLENIRKRDRKYEQYINESYLKKIQEAYFNFMKKESDIKIAVIDATNLDFVSKSSDYQKVKSCIFNKTYKKGYNSVVF